MAGPVIADTFRVALLWHQNAGSGDAVNVSHFRKSGGTGADLLAKLETHVDPNMWDLITSELSVQSIAIQKLDGVSGVVESSPSSPSDWTGGGGSQGIPQLAAIVKLRTALSGASHRGRQYLPWIAEDRQNGGVLDNTSRATTETAWGTFLSTMLVDGWELVIASYTLLTATQVDNVVVEGMAATQRRRMSRLR